MKKFNIKVNGVSYEVEVEEIKSHKTAHTHKSESGHLAVKTSIPEKPSTAAVSAPVVTTTPVAPPVQSSEATGSIKISAPMPGTILNVNVVEGEVVKKGQVLLVLEAMKMENEITASKDGTIASVNVSKGKSVNVGEVLVSMN
jgi:biotin carboxyl carrier protein